ncbi:MAG TPA: hypothetical protein VMH36_15405 [Alphaproteobacteria bacterium]|nr:hypothetical protein [Alphaproteobacteria bacterium]
MKHDARDWVSAWMLALAVIGAIAVVGHLPARHGGDARGLDIARARGLLISPADPRLLVDRDVPLRESDDTAAEEPTSPEIGAPMRPIC